MGSARQRAEYKLCARPLVARSALAKVSDQMRELAARAAILGGDDVVSVGAQTDDDNWHV